MVGVCACCGLSHQGHASLGKGWAVPPAIDLVRISPFAGRVHTRDHRAPRYCLMSCVGCSPVSLGVHCEINVDDCSPFFDPVTLGPKCFNNGKCTDRVGGYSCICPPGFVGERCEGDVNECLSNPCDTRGTQNCVQRVNDYKCECRPGYTGEHHVLAVPSARPAATPSTRSPSSAPLTLLSLAGRRCDTVVDGCKGKPCRNGGTCAVASNTGRGFICKCPPVGTCSSPAPSMGCFTCKSAPVTEGLLRVQFSS